MPPICRIYRCSPKNDEKPLFPLSHSPQCSSDWKASNRYTRGRLCRESMQSRNVSCAYLWDLREDHMP
jgi:hypothetical protein